MRGGAVGSVDTDSGEQTAQSGDQRAAQQKEGGDGGRKAHGGAAVASTGGMDQAAAQKPGAAPAESEGQECA